jgi:hypothetical protein
VILDLKSKNTKWHHDSGGNSHESGGNSETQIRRKIENYTVVFWASDFVMDVVLATILLSRPVRQEYCMEDAFAQNLQNGFGQKICIRRKILDLN